jgi:hypothetical protein
LDGHHFPSHHPDRSGPIPRNRAQHGNRELNTGECQLIAAAFAGSNLPERPMKPWQLRHWKSESGNNLGCSWVFTGETNPPL